MKEYCSKLIIGLLNMNCKHTDPQLAGIAFVGRAYTVPVYLCSQCSAYVWIPASHSRLCVFEPIMKDLIFPEVDL